MKTLLLIIIISLASTICYGQFYNFPDTVIDKGFYKMEIYNYKWYETAYELETDTAQMDKVVIFIGEDTTVTYTANFRPTPIKWFYHTDTNYVIKYPEFIKLLERLIKQEQEIELLKKFIGYPDGWKTPDKKWEIKKEYK